MITWDHRHFTGGHTIKENVTIHSNIYLTGQGGILWVPLRQQTLATMSSLYAGLYQTVTDTENSREHWKTEIKKAYYSWALKDSNNCWALTNHTVDFFK